MKHFGGRGGSQLQAPQVAQRGQNTAKLWHVYLTLPWYYENKRSIYCAVLWKYILEKSLVCMCVCVFKTSEFEVERGCA